MPHPSNLPLNDNLLGNFMSVMITWDNHYQDSPWMTLLVRDLNQTGPFSISWDLDGTVLCHCAGITLKVLHPNIPPREMD